MKKMAVLINGEFREFDIAIKSWKFMNEIDCDFYVSTWDKTIQINKKLNIHEFPKMIPFSSKETRVNVYAFDEDISSDISGNNC